MADFRHKRDGADVEFRRGLEELVRGHLDGCITALASCSSAATDDEDDAPSPVGEGSDQIALRRRRRSDLEGDDLAESSAAARRHSRILSRWVARQAEEMMINTIERRNRETELMALAGLQTVSMLDSSFLHEPRRSSPSSERRPAGAGSARLPSVLQMWRDLEVRRSRGADGRVRGARDANETDGSAYSRWASRGGEEEVEADEQRSSREQSPELRDVERERVRQIAQGWMRESAAAVAAAAVNVAPESGIPQRDTSPRSEWLGETERERVRLIRERVRTAERQQRGVLQFRRREDAEQEGSVSDQEDGQVEHVRRDLLRVRGRQARQELIMRIAGERQMELRDLSEHRAVSGFAHRNRIQSLLRGRFLRNVSPPEDDRPSSSVARELGQLRQRHPISGTREGFNLRPETHVQASNQYDDSRRTNDMSTDQSHSSTVIVRSVENDGRSEPESDYIDGLQGSDAEGTATLDGNTSNDDMSWQEPANQTPNWQRDDVESGHGEWQQSVEVRSSEFNDDMVEESDGNWPDGMDSEWSPDALEVGDDGDDGSRAPEVREEWHEDDGHQSEEDNWHDEPSDSPRDQQFSSNIRVNRFIPPDDGSVYSMELRELLGRRSVSNLLRSGFRESLDQLIQSYVQRQGHAAVDWNLQGEDSVAAQDDNQAGQREVESRILQEPPRRASLAIPPPPVPPRQPLWHSVIHQNSWAQQGLHRSEFDWDVINDLKADMTRLRQGMSHMQRMLEACMDMQIELQRSVRQEVSAALNRSVCVCEQGTGAESSSDGSKWSLVRKGTCCVCCESPIDSLLYRCGHMCTCSKCGNELVRSNGGGGKCPLCRAPIVEVIRVYSIL